MIRHHQNVFSGYSPMDSCPDCFSDYYAPIEQNKVLLCFLAGATNEEVGRAIESGRKKSDQDYAETFMRAIEKGRKKSDQDYALVVA